MLWSFPHTSRALVLRFRCSFCGIQGRRKVVARSLLSFLDFCGSVLVRLSTVICADLYCYSRWLTFGYSYCGAFSGVSLTRRMRSSSQRGYGGRDSRRYSRVCEAVSAFRVLSYRQRYLVFSLVRCG